MSGISNLHLVNLILPLTTVWFYEVLVMYNIEIKPNNQLTLIIWRNVQFYLTDLLIYAWQSLIPSVFPSYNFKLWLPVWKKKIGWMTWDVNLHFFWLWAANLHLDSLTFSIISMNIEIFSKCIPRSFFQAFGISPISIQTQIIVNNDTVLPTVICIFFTPTSPPKR